MPHYEYQCDSCSHLWEEYESIHEHTSAGKVCSSCGGSAHQVFSADCLAIQNGASSVKQDPTTVAQLADRNRTKMGRYEYDSKIHNDKFEQLRQKRKDNAPWWRPGTEGPSKEAFKAVKDIGNMTKKGETLDKLPDDTRRYLEGD